MNKVILHGHVATDITLRRTQSGKAVADFNVATNEGSGDRKRAEFTRCVAWDKTAEIADRYLRKGSEVALEGRLQTRQYDKDGQKRWKTEVVIGNLEFCGKRGDSQSDEASRFPPPPDGADVEVPF